MGATIQPDFERKPVAWTKVQCESCGKVYTWSFEERHTAYEQMTCFCGDMLPWPDFYPTEFQWEEVSWTYTNTFAVLEQMGIVPDYCGRVSTAHIFSNAHRIIDPHRREAIWRIAELASRLQVDITWG